WREVRSKKTLCLRVYEREARAMVHPASRLISCISLALTLLLGLLASACQSTMSVEEARQASAAMTNAQFVPPPRTVSDIIGILDRQRGADSPIALRDLATRLRRRRGLMSSPTSTASAGSLRAASDGQSRRSTTSPNLPSIFFRPCPLSLGSTSSLLWPRSAAGISFVISDIFRSRS